jgi:hypothetical protein
MFRYLVMRIPAPRNVLFLVLSVLVLAVVAACDNDSAKSVSTQGTVVYVPLEGGFYGIVGDDGNHWDPDNLSDEFATDSLRVSFNGLITDHPTYHMWGRTVEITSMKPIGNPPVVNLEPFRELARNASCADVRNRLFLIDQRLVFWDRESKCADAAYAQTLYDRRPGSVLCNVMDSIAGPQRRCNADAPFINMFDTILGHLDAPDLGLGSGHTVTPVNF